MSILSNFKRRSLAYQTLVAGLIFFLVYTLYLDYSGSPSLGESFLAAAIFASSYFVTSTIVLRRKAQRRR
ncbi:MAG: hypothetical protein WCY97_00705 [Methanothrix sp.]|jgi:hypothetical protein|uniref:Uncharacterized protein n=1 Tax=Methanothrix harundinacea TaxID=301375 RepID=A0A117MD97_9EURY|nr:MAG: hypothetical protein APR56_02365 [Methanosaeta sp. SDB]KUK45376.1 MAG: Uncharacterized protein XD72_0279 [Methanothrix harundinacea]MDD2637849.1 hypothetical protein [Methanothrix sp.]MDI9399664.1 hypothetical protein [Euryarchaeota archaeon]KUK97704.1 MAG: Uncharacterized protein XE07_0118 [Methanothrix harundinacea]